MLNSPTSVLPRPPASLTKQNLTLHASHEGVKHLTACFERGRKFLQQLENQSVDRSNLTSVSELKQIVFIQQLVTMKVALGTFPQSLILNSDCWGNRPVDLGVHELVKPILQILNPAWTPKVLGGFISTFQRTQVIEEIQTQYPLPSISFSYWKSKHEQMKLKLLAETDFLPVDKTQHTLQEQTTGLPASNLNESVRFHLEKLANLQQNTLQEDISPAELKRGLLLAVLQNSENKSEGDSTKRVEARLAISNTLLTKLCYEFAPFLQPKEDIKVYQILQSLRQIAQQCPIKVLPIAESGYQLSAWARCAKKHVQSQAPRL